jgi:hypothetical protein
VVDLAIALPVDDPPDFTLRRPARRPGKTAPLVAMLDCFDVPEVPGDAIEL